MGYDMRWIERPAEEVEAVAQARKVWDEALLIRDALPKSEKGVETPDEFMTKDWGAPANNASDRYKVAQRAVMDASRAISAAERSYFRLNISGMCRAIDVLAPLGLIFEATDRPAWPDSPDADKF